MVSIQLDSVHQKRLEDVAKFQGQDAAELARRILMGYLDFLALPKESDEVWGEASVALTPEIMGQENWNRLSDGS